MKLSIVIPVYNEAATVGTLLDLVAGQPLPGDLEKEMIIIESNSTDGCREIVQGFCRLAPGKFPGLTTKLILQERPQGKGFAVQEGLRAATGDIILIQDGDLEYDVQDYPTLLLPIIEHKADFVLGSRHLSAGGWKIRKFSESAFRSWVLNFGGVLFHSFFNLLYQVRLTDPTTMFKVFRRSAIDGLEFYSKRFDFDFELVAKLIRSGHTPLEVPISYKSRGFEEGKKVRMIADPLLWIRAIVRFRFAPLKKNLKANSTAGAVCEDTRPAL